MTAAPHIPVLLRETVDMLNLSPGMMVVDCTAGGGGHSSTMMKEILPSGFLVAIDRDPRALEAAEESLGKVLADLIDPPTDKLYHKPYVLVHSNFSRIKEIVKELGIDKIDAALMDLGVNSFQLDEGERGFSYQHPGDLDMRMNPEEDGVTAMDVIGEFSAAELENILWRYGEERWSRRIARFIVAEREKAPIVTTDQLVAVILKAIPAGAREDGPHPAKRSFQALRIFVNRELDVLEQAITDTVDLLAPGGRLAVIDFHSLEDRLVKNTFRTLATGCICPKDFPVCVCGKKPKGKILTAKPVLPGSHEIGENPRARSAKMRAFEKS